MTSGINTALVALAAQRNLQRTQSELTATIARLSSGLRINSARDDAAGLSIAERIAAQIRGGRQAVRNANDGISLAQTAEGALGTLGENLQRMRELAVQAANATNSDADRAALQLEVADLAAEVDRVAVQTQFNGIKLIDGSFASNSFHVGANPGQTITVASIDSARAAALGRYQGVALIGQSIGAPTVVLANARPLTVTVGGAGYALGTLLIDAKVIASAINSAGIQGLSASTNATYVPPSTSMAAATAPGTAQYTLNNVVIPIYGVNGAGALDANRAAAVAAINAYTSQTGVVATDAGTGVSLAAADGRNVTTAFWRGSLTDGDQSDFGLPVPDIVGATVNVTYAAPAGVTGSLVFQQDSVLGANLGFTNSTPIGLAGITVAAVDVATLAGALAALPTLDQALAAVAASRAKLGGMQNRFASAVAHLQTMGDNLTAAHSRIVDADYAFEIAKLTRTQILQDAGTAMLALANQSLTQVLRLLR